MKLFINGVIHLYHLFILASEIPTSIFIKKRKNIIRHQFDMIPWDINIDVETPSV